MKSFAMTPDLAGVLALACAVAVFLAAALDVPDNFGPDPVAAAAAPVGSAIIAVRSAAGS